MFTCCIFGGIHKKKSTKYISQSLLDSLLEATLRNKEKEEKIRERGHQGGYQLRGPGREEKRAWRGEKRTSFIMIYIMFLYNTYYVN